ncbi:LPXTG cell wall anchor domain-containing protein [Kitasatospora sp. NPDC002227]|uniref:LPXTG cell wall anchor domain-containing protein n=1 Tax=Kitasatospora sp. NPDC002227 TaxID=3154773 RepID=UPI00331A1F0D
MCGQPLLAGEEGQLVDALHHLVEPFALHAVPPKPSLSLGRTEVTGADESVPLMVGAAAAALAGGAILVSRRRLTSVQGAEQGPGDLP